MIRYYALAVAILVLDQTTKHLALATLQPGYSVDVLPFLAWTLAFNTGAAFSMFQGAGGVIAVIAVCVSGYLAYAIWKLRETWFEGVCYAFVLAGALGNLADRAQHGHVVDFIHVHYGWFNFPVFNVADSAITLGAAGWIWLLLMDMRRRRATPES